MENHIYVNQIGYTPLQIKQGFAPAAKFPNASSFSIINSEGKTVFQKDLITSKADNLYKSDVLVADFSEFTAEGKYKLQIESATGLEKSYEFQIRTKIFNNLFYSTLNYFTLSRCGQDINQDPAYWNHKACHTGIAEIYGTNESKQVLGGWHDAGDYGRYIVAGSKTVMDLLLAYDSLPENYSDFNILDEVRFELEWMLQMQREDGAVYHKISCYHFCAFIMPEQENDKLVLAPISTAATADFAGCLAYAAKYFSSTDADFSNRLIEAAKKAQEYLDCHEDELYRNPEGITTGGYGDWNVKDERYFALCSLFAATGNTDYLTKAIEIREKALSLPDTPDEPWKRNWIESFGWGSVAGYGTEILLKNTDKFPETNKSYVEKLKTAVIEAANGASKYSNESNFGVALKNTFWGCNGLLCDFAHMMLLAYDLTGDKKYWTASEKQVNYLLGCNPLDICYVTGSGTNYTKHPHHRPSGATGKLMPGMLAGGPCAGLHDQAAKSMLQGKDPLLCYIDVQASYSTNEIAIYWNSPFVYLLAKLNLI